MTLKNYPPKDTERPSLLNPEAEESERLQKTLRRGHAAARGEKYEEPLSAVREGPTELKSKGPVEMGERGQVTAVPRRKARKARKKEERYEDVKRRLGGYLGEGRID